MPKPWEKYKKSEEQPSGPWSKYAPEEAAPVAEPGPLDYKGPATKFFEEAPERVAALRGGGLKGMTLGYLDDVESEAREKYPTQDMVGQFAGSLAGPGKAVAPLMKGASTLGTIARSGAVGAGLGGLAKPEEGSTRLDNAKMGLALGAGIPAAGAALKKGGEALLKAPGFIAQKMSGMRLPEVNAYLEHKKLVDTLVEARRTGREDLLQKWAGKSAKKAHKALTEGLDRAEKEIQDVIAGKVANVSSRTKSLLDAAGRTKTTSIGPTGQRTMRADDMLGTIRDLRDEIKFVETVGGTTAKGAKATKGASTALRKEFGDQFPGASKKLQSQSELLRAKGELEKAGKDPWSFLSRDDVSTMARTQGIDENVLAQKLSNEKIGQLRQLGDLGARRGMGDLERTSRLATAVELGSPRGGDALSLTGALFRTAGRTALPATQPLYRTGEALRRAPQISPGVSIGLAELMRNKK